MQRRKLLIATDCYLPRWDGIARFLTEIIPLLSDKYEITLIAPDFEGDKKELDGITTVRVPLSSWKYADFTIANLIKSSLLNW